MVRVGRLKIGEAQPLAVIAGPCVIESESHALKMAGRLAAAARELGVPYIFKASYDKANRTSLDSYRGPGLGRGLEILARIKKDLGVPVLTDVHAPEQVGPAAAVCDILQIPAFLSRQTDLLLEAGRSGAVVNIKKGQFLSPWDIRYAVEKVRSTGNERILVTERGASFGYNNLVVDMRGLAVMKEFGVPVILDGVIAGAAALAAAAFCPDAAHFMIAGHRSTEPGASRALAALGLRPVLDLDLRLGEGSGAVLALPVVQAAARVLRDVATFDSAGVSGAKD